MLEEIERRNRGWLNAGNCPPINVFLDGQSIKCVMSVNRKKGKVVVARQPLCLNRRGDVIAQTLYGSVLVELIEKVTHGQ